VDERVEPQLTVSAVLPAVAGAAVHVDDEVVDAGSLEVSVEELVTVPVLPSGTPGASRRG
jgi:hypothetical protein